MGEVAEGHQLLICRFPCAWPVKTTASSLGPRLRDEALGPLVFVEGVAVDEEAIRLVTKAEQRSRADDAVLGLLLGGVDAKNLQVIPVFLIPLQLAFLTSMASRSAIGERRMPNVPEQEDVHSPTV